MLSRLDLSHYLIHFTKGGSDEEAFQNLLSMINTQQITASINKIKGGHQCVCLSETPLHFARNGLTNSSAYMSYKPFGIMFTKRHIFALGGRPAIYQTNEEYKLLPDSHNWRHVTYDPVAPNEIDWTWEREWRLKCESLCLNPDVATLVVPTNDYKERLRDEYYHWHEVGQDLQVEEYSLIMDKDIAIQYRESFCFPWRFEIPDSS